MAEIRQDRQPDRDSREDAQSAKSSANKWLKLGRMELITAECETVEPLADKHAITDGAQEIDCLKDVGFLLAEDAPGL